MVMMASKGIKSKKTTNKKELVIEQPKKEEVVKEVKPKKHVRYIADDGRYAWKWE